MGKKRIFILAAVGIVIGAIIALSIYLQPPLATVGQSIITKKDAKYRDKVAFIDNPDEKRALGLYQLIKKAINFEILKAHGVKISEAELQKEEERINQNTKDPVYLKKIKDIFGSDHEAYLRDFILPNLVDHSIYYDLFLNDEEIQKDSLNAAAEFITSVKDAPKMFRLVADQKKILVRGLTLSLTKGMLWEKDKNDPAETASKAGSEAQGGMKIIDQSKNKSKIAQQFEAEYAAAQSTVEEAKKWHELVVQYMKENEISPVPLNRQEEWVVLRMVKQKSKDEFQLEVAFFKKLDFSAWLEKEKVKIPVKVTDSSYLVPK